MPAVTGVTAERRTLAEAVRAAILTVHAAAGLACCADQQTQRLLRASEGLSRSALAVLLASPPDASPQQPRAPRPDDAPPRRRRPRGKRSHRGPKATAMDEDATTEPEPSGDAPAPNLAAAPGVPRRALVASGESLLSNGKGTVTSGPSLEPPWQKRQRTVLEDELERFQRENTVHEGKGVGGPLKDSRVRREDSDLRDRWADTPGVSLRASPELLQLCGAPGPAVVAPPAHLGNPPRADAAVLQQMQAALLELYRKLRVYHTHLDEVFALFCSSLFTDGRFLVKATWSVVRELLLVWKMEDHSVYRRSVCEQLSDLLEPWLGKLAEAENTSSSSTAPPTKQTC
jgi:hypothetical protein